jgi:hypothetical protein
MRTYETQIDISASNEHVWQVLTQEMPKSPAPFGILRLEGQIARGAKIKLWSEVAPKRAFALTAVTFDAPKKMVWRGGMPFGLFTGQRTFTLVPNEVGCNFEMQEVFSGPLAGMITKSMPDLTPSFIKFAQTLKSQAETL